MKKILFVCSANKQRSKTGEDFFSESHLNYHFNSAGTNHKICNKEGTNPLTEDLIEWADLIFVMENKHRDLVIKNTTSKVSNKIVVLHIKDVYKYYQKELISLLKEKVTPYLN